MKVLFAINQLAELVGASLVPVEVAEYLHSLGHRCTIAAVYVAEPLKGLMEAQDIAVTEDFSSLNAFDFDLVWVQNHTAPILGYSLSGSARPRTSFVFVHLTSQSPLGSPGIVIEPLLADRTLANSDETKAHLVKLGVSEEDIHVFPNPAPASFWRARERRSNDGRKLVKLISNHPPEEAVEALSHLQASGIETQLVGRAGGVYERVSSEMIAEASAIISIGKSVQYAIACGTPTYLYDRFGGPGYLTPQNFEQAAKANFSGRCCRRKVDGRTIAQEIVEGLETASRFVTALPEDTLALYRLEPYVDDLLAATTRLNADRVSLLEQHSPMLQRERAIALGIESNFKGHKRRTDQVTRLRRELQRLKNKRKQP